MLTHSDRFCSAIDCATVRWHSTLIPFCSRRRDCNRCCTGISCPSSEHTRQHALAIFHTPRCKAATCTSNTWNSFEQFVALSCDLLLARQFFLVTARHCIPSKLVCWLFSGPRPTDVREGWFHRFLCHESLAHNDRIEHSQRPTNQNVLRNDKSFLIATTSAVTSTHFESTHHKSVILLIIFFSNEHLHIFLETCPE